MTVMAINTAVDQIWPWAENDFWKNLSDITEENLLTEASVTSFQDSKPLS